jgi:hypothetical protein
MTFTSIDLRVSITFFNSLCLTLQCSAIASVAEICCMQYTLQLVSTSIDKQGLIASLQIKPGENC